MYVGPSAPKFISPGVLKVLQDVFNLQLISGDAKADLPKMLGEVKANA
jgi:hydroxylamine reductase